MDTNEKAANAVGTSNAAPKRRRWMTTGSGLDESHYQEKEKRISIRARGTEVDSPVNETHVPKLARPIEEPSAKAVATLRKEQPISRRPKKSIVEAGTLCRAGSRSKTGKSIRQTFICSLSTETKDEMYDWTDFRLPRVACVYIRYKSSLERLC